MRPNWQTICSPGIQVQGVGPLAPIADTASLAKSPASPVATNSREPTTKTSTPVKITQTMLSLPQKKTTPQLHSEGVSGIGARSKKPNKVQEPKRKGGDSTDRAPPSTQLPVCISDHEHQESQPRDDKWTEVNRKSRRVTFM